MGFKECDLKGFSESTRVVLSVAWSPCQNSIVVSGVHGTGFCFALPTHLVSWCSTDAGDHAIVAVHDDAGPVLADLPGDTDRSVPLQTRQSRRGRACRGHGQILLGTEALHQPHHTAEVGSEASHWVEEGQKGKAIPIWAVGSVSYFLVSSSVPFPEIGQGPYHSCSRKYWNWATIILAVGCDLLSTMLPAPNGLYSISTLSESASHVLF